MNQQTQSNDARTGLVGGAILVALGVRSAASLA